MSHRALLVIGLVLLCVPILWRLEFTSKPAPEAMLTPDEGEAEQLPRSTVKSIPAARLESTVEDSRRQWQSQWTDHCQVQGWIRNDENQGIVNAQIFALSHFEGNERILAKTRAGESGVFELRFPVAEGVPVQEFLSDVLLRVSAPSYVTKYEGVSSSITEAKQVRKNIVLKSGGMVRGRVVDANGKPVDGANVSIGSKPRMFGSTGFDGCFEIESEMTGHFPIVAWAEGYGAATTELLSIERNRDKIVPDVSLQQVGGIAGVVLFPDGTPVQDVCVQALLVGEELAHEYPPNIPHLIADGLLMCTSETQADGSFYLGGLGQGDFAVTIHPGGLGSFLETSPRVSPQQDTVLARPGMQGVAVEFPFRIVRLKIRDVNSYRSQDWSLKVTAFSKRHALEDSTPATLAESLFGVTKCESNAWGSLEFAEEQVFLEEDQLLLIELDTESHGAIEEVVCMEPWDFDVTVELHLTQDS